jgi:hypothetical protein
MNNVFRYLLIAVIVIIILMAAGVVWQVGIATERALQPLQKLQQSNASLQTQVADFLHPTPTVIPDPVTIIHEVRSLARLETIQYNVEKVITAETGQGTLGFLLGDRLLFVAHGMVIAGVDLEKIQPEDFILQGGALKVRLPASEVFIATLDNEKSYVYDRDTGILTQGDPNLEKTARQAAEKQILQAALDDGILDTARQNAENFLERLLRDLGYPEVIFIESGS